MASRKYCTTIRLSVDQTQTLKGHHPQEKFMKWLFLAVVVVACVLLGASMVFIDNGILRDSIVCGLGALFGFLLAYQMQAKYSVLDDD
jgi:Na+-transporting NADH:ubiquinone oxidoreductase subunit NqrE